MNLSAVRSATPRSRLIEALERRTLLSVVLGQPFGNVSFAQDSGAESADLTGVFFDTNGLSDLTFTAASSNPSVVSASMSGSTFTLTPGAGRSGFAIVRLTAADPLGDSASYAFRVQITASSARSLNVNLGPNRKSFSFATSNQASATVTIKGPGTATVFMGGDALKIDGDSLHGANQELESITLNGTTAMTSVLVSGRGSGRFSQLIGNISAPSGSLGTLQVSGATLLGDVNVPGGINVLKIDSADSGSIDAGSSAVTVEGKSFVDENFTSTGAVRTLTVGQWADSDSNPETFSAASIGRVSSRGNFMPGLQLSGSLGSLRAGGSISGTWNVPHVSAPLLVGGTTSSWDATFQNLPGMKDSGIFSGNLTAPSLGFLKVGSVDFGTVNLTAPNATDLPLFTGGTMLSVHVLAAGNVGRIMASQILDSKIFAGVGTLPDGQFLPESPSDFANPASIGSITLKRRGKGVNFDSVEVAATNVGTLTLGTVKSANAGFTYGVAAESIGHLSASDISRPQTITLNAVQDAATLAAQLAAEKIQVGDLVFRIV